MSIKDLYYSTHKDGLDINPQSAIVRVIKHVKRVKREIIKDNWRHCYYYNGYEFQPEGMKQVQEDLKSFGVDDLLDFIDSIPMAVALQRYRMKPCRVWCK